MNQDIERPDMQLNWSWLTGTRQPEQAPETVNFGGVELKKGKGGPNVPKLERFKDNVITPYDELLMQKLAVAFDLNQPVLIESGSGLGKSETVDRMAAILNWESYYANCHDFDPDVLIGSKTVREDTKSGFGWKDGIVMQAIRNGGILFLDEFNFMRGETRGRLHEVLDAILRGKDEVVLIENDGERVKVHPDLRIVAAQNPPGGEYSDREVLDPPQLTRFVYLKEFTDLPREIKEARAFGFVGKDSEYELPEELKLHANPESSVETIREHPEINNAIKQLIDFEEAVNRMVESGSLGQDAAQPVYFSFQRDFNRTIQFVARYYDGDLYGTLKKALRYYYSNKFEPGIDRKKVEELIESLIGPKPVPDPNRRSLTVIDGRTREPDDDPWSPYAA
ncbi:MAG: hypothetical protein D6719_12750 [Candidatus Dadabacteria bacterium]|nr:MAG: hypothetical protein D6719_12750 [Candidatus Dadabacteria bacterium]